MKILQINNYHFPKGGSDAVYLNTGKLLKDNGNNVIYFSTNNDDNIKEGQNDYFVAPFEPGLHHLARFFYSQKVYNSLKKLITYEKPDIAHLHIFYGQLTNSVLKALRDCNVPIVMSVHEYRLLCPAYLMLNGNNEICEKCAGGNYLNSVKYKCNKNNYLYSAVSALESYYRDIFFDYKKYIDHFIMVSEFINRKHIEYYPELENKSSVLYNFKDFIKRISIERVEGNLVYFGRLSQEKGIMTLLHALKPLSNILLKIIGTGPLHEDIKEFIVANKMNNVSVLGYCTGDVLWSHIETAKFSVIPSECYENNPMSAIESLQLGTPVIGANIGGIPEIVNENHGFIFKSGSEQDLKITIKRAFELTPNDYRKLQLNGIDFANKKFSAQHHYNSLMDIYNATIINNNIN